MRVTCCGVVGPNHVERMSEPTLPQQPHVGLDTRAFVVGVVDEPDAVQAFHLLSDVSSCRDTTGTERAWLEE